MGEKKSRHPGSRDVNWPHCDCTVHYTELSIIERTIDEGDSESAFSARIEFVVIVSAGGLIIVNVPTGN